MQAGNRSHNYGDISSSSGNTKGSHEAKMVKNHHLQRQGSLTLGWSVVLSEEGCEGTPLTPRAFADNVEINVLLAFWPF